MGDQSNHIGILEPSNYSDEALSIYDSLGEVSFLGDNFDHGKISILVVRLGMVLDAEYLRKFKRLRCIVSPTTGLDHIDLDYCTFSSIEVISLRDVAEKIGLITSTAEHALGLIIALVRNTVGAHNSITHQGRWDRDSFRGHQLSDLTLGIVGYGRIGKTLHQFCEKIFKRVLVYDPILAQHPHLPFSGSSVSEATLLSESDIVTLHASANPGVVALDSKKINGMKRGAFFVNTARSSLVDEYALAENLEKGLLGGLASDVLAGEPFDETGVFENPLVHLAREGFNVLLTPHLGGCTQEAMSHTEVLLAEYLRDMLGE